MDCLWQQTTKYKATSSVCGSNDRIAQNLNCQAALVNLLIHNLFQLGFLPPPPLLISMLLFCPRFNQRCIRRLKASSTLGWLPCRLGKLETPVLIWLQALILAFQCRAWRPLKTPLTDIGERAT